MLSRASVLLASSLKPLAVPQLACSWVRPLILTSRIGSHGAAARAAIWLVSGSCRPASLRGRNAVCRAKAGIEGVTKTVAKEWGALGVRANAVAFGMIDTRMTNVFAEDGIVSVGGEQVQQGMPKHAVKMWENKELLKMVVPLARKGDADEAASGILFLASPLSSYVTGHTLEVTGGFGI